MRTFRILTLLAFLGAGFLFAAGTYAATLTLRVPALEGEPDSTLRVPIAATGTSKVGALQFDLVYDPGVLAVVGVTGGAPEANALVDANATVPGRLRVGIVTTEGIKNDTAVANVEFRVIGNPGMTSPLQIENARAWDTPDHFEVLVRSEEGQVSIIAAAPPWLIIGAIVGLVLLALLLLLFALTRRRKPTPAYASATYPPGPQVQEGWHCPRCGTANPPASRFCGTCGIARP